jgi:ribosomal protein S18 acetylase RimI-like enzyme
MGMLSWVRQLFRQQDIVEPSGVSREIKESAAIDAENYRRPWTTQDFWEYLHEGGRMCVICDKEHGGRVIGYACFRHTKAGCRVDGMAIARKNQRQGTGRLILSVLDATLDVGKLLVVYASEYNQSAHTFLRALGFKATGVKRSYYDDGTAAYRFTRRKTSDQGACGGKHEDNQ